MIEIVVPDREATRSIQEREGRYYWSRCAPVLFRREGLVAVARVTAPSGEALAVYSRGADLERLDPDLPAVIEGPLDVTSAAAVGLAVEDATMAKLRLDRPVALDLFLPRIRVRDDDGQVIAAETSGERAMWGTGDFRCQFLSGPGGRRS